MKRILLLLLALGAVCSLNAKTRKCLYRVTVTGKRAECPVVIRDVPEWARSLPNVQAMSIGKDIEDVQWLAGLRLDARPGTAYLIRPDQHVCARWRKPTEAGVRAALATATASKA